MIMHLFDYCRISAYERAESLIVSKRQEACLAMLSMMPQIKYLEGNMSSDVALARCMHQVRSCIFILVRTSEEILYFKFSVTEPLSLTIFSRNF